MNARMTHTPTPWRQGTNYPCRIIADEASIGSTCLPDDEGHENETELANAAFIALALAEKGAP